MAKMELNKKDYLKLLKTFDLPFLTTIFFEVMNQLPTKYSEILIRKEFFTTIYTGPYYLLSQDDWLEFYGTKKDVTDYLIREHPLITDKMITRIMNNSYTRDYNYTCRLFPNKNK